MILRPPTDLETISLHTHTIYSILDGADKIDAFIEDAKKRGLAHVGCTDHGYVMGLYELITKSKAAGVRPIPGVEVYLMPDDDYVYRSGPFKYFHLTLWGINQEGYRNICSLASSGWAPGKVIQFWGRHKPRVTWEDVEMFSGGVVAGTGCIEGPIAKPLIRGEPEMAMRNAERLMGIFPGRLYAEFMPSEVSSNYVRGKLITVQGHDGVTYTFHPSDTLEADGRTMTAAEAMAARATEIAWPSPERAGQRIEPPDDIYIPDPVIDLSPPKNDESVPIYMG